MAKQERAFVCRACGYTNIIDGVRCQNCGRARNEHRVLSRVLEAPDRIRELIERVRAEPGPSLADYWTKAVEAGRAFDIRLKRIEKTVRLLSVLAVTNPLSSEHRDAAEKIKDTLKP